MENRDQLNRRLAMGSKGTAWKPRITEKQLNAIRSVIGPAVRSIDRTRLQAYVESGDIESLAGGDGRRCRI